MALEEFENKAITRGNPAWLRGMPSPNPGGRPKGLASLVREQTRDGADLVDFMLKLKENKRQPMRLRMEAVAWLADRGFGKALQQLELSGAGGGPLDYRIRYPDDGLYDDDRPDAG